MSRRRKSLSGMGKGMDAFFDDETEQTEERQQDDTSTRKHVDETPDVERKTFYIRPDQDIAIEELVLQLKKQRVNTNKSELVREALDMLAEQDLNDLAHRLTNK